MALFRKDPPLPNAGGMTASQYYGAIQKGLREKADHNKTESQFSFVLVIACTLITPLFVTMGEGWFWSKALPSTLSVLAAGATTWLQLRKPHRLWIIYRRAQRQLEREKTEFDFNLKLYAEATDKDALLASKVAEIAYRVHEEWEGLVPEPDALASHAPGAFTKRPEPATTDPNNVSS